MNAASENIANLIAMIEAFDREGGDRSIGAANQIESRLQSIFDLDPRVEDFIADLASYRPFGGEHLLNESELVGRLKLLLLILEGGRSS